MTQQVGQVAYDYKHRDRFVTARIALENLDYIKGLGCSGMSVNDCVTVLLKQAGISNVEKDYNTQIKKDKRHHCRHEQDIGDMIKQNE